MAFENLAAHLGQYSGQMLSAAVAAREMNLKEKNMKLQAPLALAQTLTGALGQMQDNKLKNKALDIQAAEANLKTKVGAMGPIGKYVGDLHARSSSTFGNESRYAANLVQIDPVGGKAASKVAEANAQKSVGFANKIQSMAAFMGNQDESSAYYFISAIEDPIVRGAIIEKMTTGWTESSSADLFVGFVLPAMQDRGFTGLDPLWTTASEDGEKRHSASDGSGGGPTGSTGMGTDALTETLDPDAIPPEETEVGASIMGLAGEAPDDEGDPELTYEEYVKHGKATGDWGRGGEGPTAISIPFGEQPEEEPASDPAPDPAWDAKIHSKAARLIEVQTREMVETDPRFQHLTPEKKEEAIRDLVELQMSRLNDPQSVPLDPGGAPSARPRLPWQ